MAATASSAPFSRPEFIIYAFEKDEFSKGSSVWKALKTLDDEKDACRIAEILFRNDKFTRIEVRRKGETAPLKIFDTAPPAARKFYFMAAAACFCLISAAFLTVLYR